MTARMVANIAPAQSASGTATYLVKRTSAKAVKGFIFLYQYRVGAVAYVMEGADCSNLHTL